MACSLQIKSEMIPEICYYGSDGIIKKQKAVMMVSPLYQYKLLVAVVTDI